MTDQELDPRCEARLIGWPCEHSLSPAMHNAAFAELGLNCSYVLAPTPPGTEETMFESLRNAPVLGANVTVPHKVIAIDFVDELDESARRPQAVNTIAKEGSRLVGYNTDGAGLIAALRIDADFEPQGKRCAVLGAGGAARSVASALVDAQAAAVTIVNRTTARAEECARIAGAPAVVGNLDDLLAADLVINATSVGLNGPNDDFVCDVVSHLGPKHLVVDLVYRPLNTDLLVMAAWEHNARTLSGLSMLVHQAALSFKLWTGCDAPIELMRSAALAELAKQG